MDEPIQRNSVTAAIGALDSLKASNWLEDAKNPQLGTLAFNELSDLSGDPTARLDCACSKVLLNDFWAWTGAARDTG